MNKRKIFIILIFLFTCNAFSDEKILQCGSNKYRIKLPMVGFDKFYIEDEEKWKKLKNFEVTEDFYLVKDATREIIKPRTLPVWSRGESAVRKTF